MKLCLVHVYLISSRGEHFFMSNGELLEWVLTLILERLTHSSRCFPVREGTIHLTLLTTVLWPFLTPNLWLKGTSISIYLNPLLRAGLILPGFCRLGTLQHLELAWSSWLKVSLYLNGVFHVPACACCLSSHCCAPPKSLTASSLYHPYHQGFVGSSRVSPKGFLFSRLGKPRSFCCSQQIPFLSPVSTSLDSCAHPACDGQIKRWLNA